MSEQLSVGDAAVTMTGCAAAVALSECIFRLLYDSSWVLSNAPGLYLRFGTPFLIVILASFAFALAVQYKRMGLVLGLASVTLTIFVVSNFRGSHKWQGFQDQIDQSKVPFLVSLGLAWIAGVGLARALSRNALRLMLGAIIAVGVVWSWIDAYRGIRVMSELPYARHWALSILALLTLAAIAAQGLGFGLEEHEERLHSR